MPQRPAGIRSKMDLERSRSSCNAWVLTVAMYPGAIAFRALTPPDVEWRQKSLWWVTKMGQRDVRRLLVTDAMSVISATERKGRCDDPWLANMLKKQLRMLVAGACSSDGATTVGHNGDGTRIKRLTRNTHNMRVTTKTPCNWWDPDRVSP